MYFDIELLFYPEIISLNFVDCNPLSFAKLMGKRFV